MTLSKQTALGIALGAIVLRWIYQLVSQRSAQEVPANVIDLVLTIARDKAVLFAAIVLLLRLEGERLDALGVSFRQWPMHTGVGMAIGLVMFVGLNVVFTSVMNSVMPSPPASGPSVMAFFKQPENLLLWLPIGILGGGLVEEIERIFVITRFEKWLGQPGLILGVVLNSTMFGVGHLYQGPGTAISTGVSGLVFSLVYLRRRSAIEPIVAHAFSDVLAMVAATILAR